MLKKSLYVLFMLAMAMLTAQSVMAGPEWLGTMSDRKAYEKAFKPARISPVRKIPAQETVKAVGGIM